MSDYQMYRKFMIEELETSTVTTFFFKLEQRRKNLKTISREDSKSYYEDRFVKNNCFLLNFTCHKSLTTTIVFTYPFFELLLTFCLFVGRKS